MTSYTRSVVRQLSLASFRRRPPHGARCNHANWSTKLRNFAMSIAARVVTPPDRHRLRRQRRWRPYSGRSRMSTASSRAVPLDRNRHADGNLRPLRHVYDCRRESVSTRGIAILCDRQTDAAVHVHHSLVFRPFEGDTDPLTALATPQRAASCLGAADGIENS